MTLNRNTIILTGTGVVTLSFFLAGVTKVLDYFIIKALLFSGFLLLLALTVITVLAEIRKKNRLEDIPQDDPINIK